MRADAKIRFAPEVEHRGLGTVDVYVGAHRHTPLSQPEPRKEH